MNNPFSQFYSEKVLKEIQNPKNMGEIKNPDGVGMVGNPRCGDIMKVYIKVAKKEKTQEKYIKDIKFQTLGCGAAIAVSSIITTLAKGKSLSEAKKINGKDIVKTLGGLPKMKLHCSALAGRALKKAIGDYYLKQP